MSNSDVSKLMARISQPVAFPTHSMGRSICFRIDCSFRKLYRLKRVFVPGFYRRGSGSANQCFASSLTNSSGNAISLKQQGTKTASIRKRKMKPSRGIQ